MFWFKRKPKDTLKSRLKYVLQNLGTIEYFKYDSVRTSTVLNYKSLTITKRYSLDFSTILTVKVCVGSEYVILYENGLCVPESKELIENCLPELEEQIEAKERAKEERKKMKLEAARQQLIADFGNK